MAHTLVKQGQLLDRYSLTESLNSIFNGLIAFALRERRLEMKKVQPDKIRIVELNSLKNEVSKLHKTNESYKSLERMEELIEHYGQILMESKKKLNNPPFQV
jgi:hypothetical protein